MIGNSGAYYVKNPFGKDNYFYAKFTSEKAYDNREQGKYISEKEALEDLPKQSYKKIMGYKFTVEIFGDEPKEIKTNNLGEMQDGKDFKNYLAELYEKFGRDKVTYKMVTDVL